MNQDQQAHEERKQKIMTFLEDAAAYMDKRAASDLVSEEDQSEAQAHAQSLRKLRENVQNNLFSIVLVGEFSAGKSTFLNALMHQKVLPSFSREATATVNFLRSKEWAPNGEAGIVYYQDGTTKTLDRLDQETLKAYVSTEGETSGVEHVDLFFDNKFLKDGVMLVDSPGLNGVTSDLANITRKQIEESHASIFMFSADHPGSRSDFEALRELKAKCHRIFIVLNKIDMIKASEGETPETIKKQLIDSYCEQFPDDSLPEIYPIAAYPALLARDDSLKDYRDGTSVEALEEKPRLEPFENRLWRHLTQGEQTKEQLISPIRTACSVLEGEKKHEEDMIHFLENTRSSAELSDKKEKMEEAIDALNKQKKDMTVTLNQQVETAMSDLKNQMHGRFDTMVKQINSEAAGQESPDDLSDFAAGLPNRINQRCLRVIDEANDDLRRQMQDVVQVFCMEQLDQAMEALNKIPNLPTTFHVPNIEINDATVGKNLEAMTRQFEEKEAELERMRAEIGKKRLATAAARRRDMEIERLEQEIRDLKSNKMNFENTFTIREAVTSTEEQTYVRDRRGIFGKIAQVFVGGKEVSKSVIVHDNSAQLRDQKRYDDMVSGMAGEIDKKRGELDGLKGSAANSEVLNEELQQLKDAMERKSEKLAQDREKYGEQLKKDAAKAMQRMCRDIDYYVGDTVRLLCREAENQIDDQKRAYAKMVRGMAQATIDAELKKKEMHLKDLCDAADASDKERDAKLSAAQAASDELLELLKAGTALEAELDVGLNDTIQEGGLA